MGIETKGGSRYTTTAPVMANFPGRPVVSQIGDPTYHMCKILTKILNLLDEGGRSYVSDSFELKKFSKNSKSHQIGGCLRLILKLYILQCQ